MNFPQGLLTVLLACLSVPTLASGSGETAIINGDGQCSIMVTSGNFVAVNGNDAKLEVIGDKLDWKRFPEWVTIVGCAGQFKGGNEITEEKVKAALGS